MSKIILNKQQVADLVLANRYLLSGNKFLSRCIDGRYEEKLKTQMSNSKINNYSLPALALPGADLGQLALIFATGNAFGFAVNREKAFKALVKIIGGEENFHFHTDDYHFQKNNRLSLSNFLGCGHWQQIQLDPKTYNLEDDDIQFINSILTAVAKKIEKPVILEGDHQEGAILIVKGVYGIYPKFFITTEEGRKSVQVFIYHKTFIDERHRLLVKTLIEEKAVELYPGCDEEYLYQVLSEEGENHFFETIKRLAKSLPLFQVEFKEGGSFNLEEKGEVL